MLGRYYIENYSNSLARDPLPKGLPESHIAPDAPFVVPAKAGTHPRLPMPRGTRRTETMAALCAAAAAGGEQGGPPRLPRGSGLGPGSWSGATAYIRMHNAGLIPAASALPPGRTTACTYLMSSRLRRACCPCCAGLCPLSSSPRRRGPIPGSRCRAERGELKRWRRYAPQPQPVENRADRRGCRENRGRAPASPLGGGDGRGPGRPLRQAQDRLSIRGCAATRDEGGPGTPSLSFPSP